MFCQVLFRGQGKKSGNTEAISNKITRKVNEKHYKGPSNNTTVSDLVSVQKCKQEEDAITKPSLQNNKHRLDARNTAAGLTRLVRYGILLGHWFLVADEDIWAHHAFIQVLFNSAECVRWHFILKSHKKMLHTGPRRIWIMSTTEKIVLDVCFALGKHSAFRTDFPVTRHIMSFQITFFWDGKGLEWKRNTTVWHEWWKQWRGHRLRTTLSSYVSPGATETMMRNCNWWELSSMSSKLERQSIGFPLTWAEAQSFTSKLDLRALLFPPCFMLHNTTQHKALAKSSAHGKSRTASKTRTSSSWAAFVQRVDYLSCLNSAEALNFLLPSSNIPEKTKRLPFDN